MILHKNTQEVTVTPFTASLVPCLGIRGVLSLVAAHLLHHSRLQGDLKLCCNRWGCGDGSKILVLEQEI